MKKNAILQLSILILLLISSSISYASTANNKSQIQNINNSKPSTNNKSSLKAKSSKPADYGKCLKAIDFYERKYSIPHNLLYALTIVESGRWQEAHNISLPYPWVLNIEGQPYFFENKQEATTFLKKALKQGKKSIDVGCGQVNIHYHGHHFEKPENLLNPVYNIAYTAYFMARNFAESGNWPKAVAQYHSRTPELGKNYWQKVQAVLKSINKNKDKFEALRSANSIKPSQYLVKANNKTANNCKQPVPIKTAKTEQNIMIYKANNSIPLPINSPKSTTLTESSNLGSTTNLVELPTNMVSLVVESVE